MKTFYYINRALPDLDKDGNIPRWIQLAPVGEFPITLKVEKDGKIEKKAQLQIVDAASIAAMAKSFQGPALLDFDHESYDIGKRSTAAGWILAVEDRGKDGLWGEVDWSDSGKAAIKGKEYRYISPVFPADGVEQITEEKIRPLVMESAALTNTPNMETIAPIFNKAACTCGGDNINTPKIKNMDYKAILLKILGLPADATDDQITEARSDISNKIKNLDQEKKDLIEQIIDLEIEGVEFEDEEEKDAIKEVLRTNRKAGQVFLRNRKKTTVEKPEPREPLTNRKPAKTPTGNPGGEQASAEDTKNAAVISNRAYEISQREGIPWSRAFNRAKSEFSK